MEQINHQTIRELKHLIADSCAEKKPAIFFQNFHKRLIQCTYGSKDVHIDYHRKRVSMTVISEETEPKGRNSNGMYANLYFSNMRAFLEQCVRSNPDNTESYRNLVNDFRAFNEPFVR